MNSRLSELAQETFRGIVGTENVSDDWVELPSIHLQTYADVSGNKIAMRNRKCVVRPSSIKEIQEIVRAARSLSLPMVPLGGATTFYVSGGPVTTEKESIVLDLRRMNQILDLDEFSGTVTVQPCVTVEQLNKFLERKGLRYPHHPESRITATVAGAISVNGISPFSTKFGRPGDQVLAMKVVLSDGEIYDVGNKTMFDNVFRMKNLFIGTEGCVGIITEITLKVYPIPKSRMMELFGFKNLDDVAKALQGIVDSGLVPESVMIPERQRIYNEALLPLLSTVDVSEILEDNEQFVLVVFSGDAPIVKFSIENAETIIQSNGGTKIRDHRVVESYWENLTQIGAVVTPQMNATYGGRKYNSIRGGIPIRALAKYNKAVREALPPGDKLIDAGITSYVFLPQLDAIQICGVLLNDGDSESVVQFNAWAEKVCELSKKFGGTISASGAIGTLLLNFAQMEMPGSSEVARKIKKALDSDHLLNPGKMF